MADLKAILQKSKDNGKSTLQQQVEYHKDKNSSPKPKFILKGAGKKKSTSDSLPASSQKTPEVVPVPSFSPSKNTIIDEISEVVDEQSKEAERITAAEFQFEEQPDKYTKEEVFEIRNAFDTLANSLTDKLIVGQVVNKILSKLKENAHLRDIIMPEDAGLMVRALRESYGITLANKKKRAQTRTQNTEDVDEALSLLKDVGFDQI